MNPTTRMMRKAGIPQAGQHFEGLPKSDSIFSNQLGTYAFGIFETAQALLGIRLKVGEEMPAKFLEVVELDTISEHVSRCGEYVMVFAVRKGGKAWVMPEKSYDDFERSRRNWNRINYGELLTHE